MFFEKDFQNEYKKMKSLSRILQLKIEILWGELNVRNNFVSFSYVSHIKFPTKAR